jgi:hypothetical protein
MRRCTKCGHLFTAGESPLAHICPPPADLPEQLAGKAPPVASSTEAFPPVATATVVRPVGDPDYCPEPALPPEAWLTFPHWGQFRKPPVNHPNVMHTQHGTAAANLFGQPFGFDVQDAIDEVKMAELVTTALTMGAPDPGGELAKAAERCISRGRRIKALLPPIEGPDHG